jgi:hypothetical protein
MKARHALVVTLICVMRASGAGAADPDGWTYKSGDHRLDLGGAARLRYESWDAFAPATDAFTASRTRVRAQYGFRGRMLFGELQDVRLHGMDEAPGGSGALVTYRNANGGDGRAGELGVRQLFAEFRPTETSFLRVGRQELKLGPEVLYPEPDWRYLKTARLGERLIGSVGWSHAERMVDGASGGWDLGKHYVFGFAASAAQGVFSVDDAYQRLPDVRFAGGSWTLERGTLAPNSELSLFAVGYEDERSIRDGGLPDDVRVWTAGAHWLGIHPLGPGKVDALFWLAGQTGDFNDLDHTAYAWLAEVGYQLPQLPAKPWLRAGVNLASGDGDATDGDHETFFNLLPTNHLYYGFADQLAFQNLINSFVQVRLAPHPKLALNAFVHWLRLEDDFDGRYAGTGAFDEQVFGYPMQANPRGRQHVGVEYDLVATLTPHRAVTVELGVSVLDGGALFNPSASRHLAFFYTMVEVKY